MEHRESPTSRINPSGRKVWIARFTGPDGRRRSAGTFAKKREAQDAIDRAYQLPANVETLGAYLEGWTARHPRSERTNRTNEHRISRVLQVPVEGRALEFWPIRELKRRHALELVDHMLREQGRSPLGATQILRSLSALAEDAITDELSDSNPFRGVRVRASDPRAQKAAREPRVWQWSEMHSFAAAAGRYEPMVRMLSDCGLRVGELFALERAKQDLSAGEFRVSGTAWNGQVVGSSREKRHDRSGPIPPGCLELLRGMPARIDSPWLFPTKTGKLWRLENFYRTVWHPARTAAGINPTPQEFRHSWTSLLRAAGVDPADLAEVAGHSVAVQSARYTHPLRRSHDTIRDAIG